MKLTPDQLRQAADAMEAHAAGNVVEYRHHHENIWYAAKPHEALAWELDLCAYRPKPEPVTRPWAKASDLPVGISYIRKRNYAGWSIILAAGEKGLYALSDGGMLVLLWDELEDKEHSTDRKTWLPCTVTEQP